MTQWSVAAVEQIVQYSRDTLQGWKEGQEYKIKNQVLYAELLKNVNEDGTNKQKTPTQMQTKTKLKTGTFGDVCERCVKC